MISPRTDLGKLARGRRAQLQHGRSLLAGRRTRTAGLFVHDSTRIQPDGRPLLQRTTRSSLAHPRETLGGVLSRSLACTVPKRGARKGAIARADAERGRPWATLRRQTSRPVRSRDSPADRAELVALYEAAWRP
jgi:hypothetical protein